MEFIGARWKLMGGGGQKSPAVNRDSQDKPDRIHMTEVHPGEVGVKEGPYRKVGETGGMARVAGWQLALDSQERTLEAV